MIDSLTQQQSRDNINTFYFFLFFCLIRRLNIIWDFCDWGDLGSALSMKGVRCENV